MKINKINIEGKGGEKCKKSIAHFLRWRIGDLEGKIKFYSSA